MGSRKRVEEIWKRTQLKVEKLATFSTKASSRVVTSDEDDETSRTNQETYRQRRHEK